MAVRCVGAITSLPIVSHTGLCVEGTGLPALRAQELLLRSQPRSVRAEERLFLLVGAAKLATPGMLAGTRRDVEI